MRRGIALRIYPPSQAGPVDAMGDNKKARCINDIQRAVVGKSDCSRGAEWFLPRALHHAVRGSTPRRSTRILAEGLGECQ